MTMNTAEPAILEAMLQSRQPQGWGGLWQGVHPALVVDVKDPDSQGRVKIRLPWSPDAGGAVCELWALLDAAIRCSVRSMLSFETKHALAAAGV